MTITATKRKLISRDAAKHDGAITFAALQAISNRYQTPLDDVRKLLAAMGYRFERAPEPQQAGRVLTKKTATAAEAMHGTAPDVSVVSRETLATILSGSLFRILDTDPDADPRRVFVVTTLDKFRREREAIKRLLRGLSADLPPEDARDSSEPG
jgi:hypothetical protein